MKKMLNNFIEKLNNGLEKVPAWVFYTLLVISFLLFASVFFIRFGDVDGISMEPTLNENTKFIYTTLTSDIKNNDIVCACPNKDTGRVIKRAVGVGGDKIEVKDGILYINGVKDTTFTEAEYDEDFCIIVPKDSYFLMGDNRNESLDSRDYGCVPKNRMTGKVIKVF